jgi:hypothetical protein
LESRSGKASFGTAGLAAFSGATAAVALVAYLERLTAHLYSFSFAPCHDRYTRYPGRSEILDYLRRVATEHRLVTSPLELRFGHSPQQVSLPP